MAAPLVDGFGRAFEYLRLSVDEACNFRCVYCLPNGYERREQEPPLSVEEIRRLAGAFAAMGFWKVRLTGGEPTLRRDLVAIASAVASTPGVRRVTLSTNGFRLAELAAPLREAGVRGVNVSVDSLDPERFRRITGHDRLPSVLAGIGRCLALGFDGVKVNMVLLRGMNDDELGGFLDWTRETPVSVRFIELMQTAGSGEFFARRHLPASNLVAELLAEGWREAPRSPGDGPARRFSKEGHRGEVGVIAPYASDFCATCNRLRVTSRGRLRLCLFAEEGLPLRELLQSDDQALALQERVRALLGRKEVSHYLPEGRFGDVRHLAMMGG
ncbi:MAG: GTP 3',8-cyclase MoaA [Elusimicrobia bacterium]|nr:GTP 3',8-cyclase MoaA [Elusimicrobiota bacterium]